MRKRFKQDIELDAMPISEVVLDGKSRHQLIPLLSALQYIFITPEYSEKIFKILSDKILSGKKRTGREGMSLWEILVLGLIRVNLNIDFDFLQDMANSHKTVRGILGVDTAEIFTKGKYYELQTIKDNVQLLDDQTIQEINLEIVKIGHELKKKNKEEKIEFVLKTDTYAVEANIHFPTDLNLLWDSARKCLDVMGEILKYYSITGWREHKSWSRKIKKEYRNTSEIHRKKGNNYEKRLRKATKKYLGNTRKLKRLIYQNMDELMLLSTTDNKIFALIEALLYYYEMLDKHIDLVDRRIMKGEKIPHEEKVFSIFEPHVEWLSKNKHGRIVELGHKTVITSDQYNFIVDFETLFKQHDTSLPIPIVKRLKRNFLPDNYFFKSISFDKGFYSRTAKAYLENEFETVAMPKRGKKTLIEEGEENKKNFKKLLNAHSAVESNINELEHNGVNIILDKGEDGFKRYVAYGVLSYNLKRLGKIIIEKKLLKTVIKINTRRKQAA